MNDKSKGRRFLTSKQGLPWIVGAWVVALIVSEIAFSTLKNKGWTTYTPANSGLAGKSGSALAIDGQGRVWMETSRGLNSLDYDAGVSPQVLQVFYVIRIMLWITAGLGILAIVGTAIRRRGVSATTKPVRIQPSEVSPLPPTAAVATTPTEPIPTTLLVIPEDPETAFAQELTCIQAGKRDEAKACFMQAFRAGSPDLRRRALTELEKLGEVESS